MAVTETAAETVAEVAEEVAETADHVAEMSRALQPREMRMLLAGVGIGLVGGFVVGGLYATRRLRTEFEKLAEAEIEEMREHFQKRLRVREEKPDLSEAAKEIVKREGYDGPATPIKEDKDGAEAGGSGQVKGTEEVVLEEEVEVVSEGEAPEASVTNVTNIFVESEKSADEGWDYEEEVRLRRPDRPYVIHYDERAEKDYTEATLVYYAGDDVLCDEKDTPVDDKEKVVGEGNLEKFGHGSNDNNVVYVRNDVLEIEIEIVKNDGSYAEVVHGFKHSEPDHRRGHHRFDDEPTVS